MRRGTALYSKKNKLTLLQQYAPPDLRGAFFLEQDAVAEVPNMNIYLNIIKNLDQHCINNHCSYNTIVADFNKAVKLKRTAMCAV